MQRAFSCRKMNEFFIVAVEFSNATPGQGTLQLALAYRMRSFETTHVQDPQL